ncbi:uncharacterized protein DS421_20g689690 [Arachis hypogaea]|nr:uncharacterized protein DS421_20g689690 [Arachis hypogaea]
MSLRHEKEMEVNVQVLLLCRPFSDDELRSKAPQVVTCNDYNREVAVSQNIAGKHIDRVFTFDKVFGPNARQQDLYDQAIIPIVNEVLEGFNCTIFAYGQTGTGKTYTMEGECKRSKSGPNGELPAEAGVIPRAVKQIFDTLESQNAEYSVKVTFLELYNEEITDLLAPEELSKVSLEDKQKKQLPLMEDGKGGILVRGLEEEIVTSEIFTLLERGSAKRRTAETLLNKQSSRSHSLFSITIHIKEATPEVDLAGSENISRSGAREGRAREAGEINKSLVTLGRVINALVEHLGHVPYRDSKLTRLLRDSLGGRTKTCIIATVSPEVHCLEETLSTLDYAHRAKHIKNKPEVNQKMMKSTLIKDLYGEIERLKAGSTREKNGVYIPKERFYQEKSERKAMADQIEQMGLTIENHQKQYDDLNSRYIEQVQHCSDLSNKLDTTQKNLNKTSELLTNTEDELRRSQYTVKEKDFIISVQRKAENALAHQACVLRADLEKVLQDNASLFLKIGREDKLNLDNRAVVNNFQAELAQQVGYLCNIVATSLSEQSEHLKCVEKLCHSFLGVHDKVVLDLKNKVTGLRNLYLSHTETVQNDRLHKASSDGVLEELSSLISSNGRSIQEFLESEATQAGEIFDELQSSLSTQQGELAVFAREMRHEQSRSDSEKLIADMTSLVSDHIRRQMDLVRFEWMKSLLILDKAALRTRRRTCVIKKETKDTADYSAAKHCRMELLMQQSVSTAGSALEHMKRTHEAVNEKESKHISAAVSLISNASNSNEQHDMGSILLVLQQRKMWQRTARISLSSLMVIMSAQERESISGMLDVVKTHSNTLETFREDHAGQASSIEEKARETFQQHYRDYEPSGNTPVRCETDVPSKGTIESLQSLPVESLLEEFQENNSSESSVKELKPSLIPRSPLSALN